jgi:signal transduction histidine kinase
MRWWFICIVLVLIVLIVLFVYNYYRVRKMVDIERMRVRIASDLHDDVGSALTEIALQSDFLQTMDVTEDLQESLQQIGSQSRKIVTSLDDIVWSIDARNDTVGDLTDRMQDYVNSVLPQKQINYQFEGDMQEKLKVSLKENLYLIFKEAVNNIAKHSNAERVDITLSTNGAGFEMRIKDNGKNASNVRKSGQGLRNMKMRAKRIDASVSFYYNNGFEVVVKSNK